MSEESKANRPSKELPIWPDIKVTLEYPSGIDPVIDVSDPMVEAFEQIEPTNPYDIPYIRPFAYFKFNDEKKRSLKLTVRYTRSAWFDSLKAGGSETFPLIFYRAYKNGIWDNEWVPIEIDEGESSIPGDGPYGILIAYIDNIPDPAIGGC